MFFFADGRTFGPVTERPLPEPWFKPTDDIICKMPLSLTLSTTSFDKQLSECKKLNSETEKKLVALNTTSR